MISSSLRSWQVKSKCQLMLITHHQNLMFPVTSNSNRLLTSTTTTLINSSLSSRRKLRRLNPWSSSTQHPAHIIRNPKPLWKRNCLLSKTKFQRHFPTIPNIAAISDSLMVSEESQSSQP
jgi:hypothetical protein